MTHEKRETRTKSYITLIDSVVMRKGTRMLETYGDALTEPRVQYLQSEGYDFTVTYIKKEC